MTRGPRSQILPPGKLEKDVAHVLLVLLAVIGGRSGLFCGVDRPARPSPLESLGADETLVVADGEADLVVVVFSVPFAATHHPSFQNVAKLLSSGRGRLRLLDPKLYTFDLILINPVLII